MACHACSWAGDEQPHQRMQALALLLNARQAFGSDLRRGRPFLLFPSGGGMGCVAGLVAGAVTGAVTDGAAGMAIVVAGEGACGEQMCDIADFLAVFAEFVAGMLAGGVAGVGYGVRVPIISRVCVADRMREASTRRHAALPFLPETLPEALPVVG